MALPEIPHDPFTSVYKGKIYLTGNTNSFITTFDPLSTKYDKLTYTLTTKRPKMITWIEDEIYVITSENKVIKYSEHGEEVQYGNVPHKKEIEAKKL